MKSMVEISHDFLKDCLHSQAICVDATLGQGKDSQFFLKYSVRKVVAFEIQKEAIDAVKEIIHDDRFEVHHIGHEHIDEVVDTNIDAAIFNFGYCPDLDESIMTRKETSLLAVKKVLEKLKVRGRLALVFYPHEEGRQEALAIEEYLKTVSHKQFHIHKIENLNVKSPYLIQIEKIKRY